MPESTQKNRDDLIISFRLLGSHLQDFEKGDFFFYVPISVELRKLLCDTKDGKSFSLLTRVIPHAKLPKLHFTKIIDGMPSLLNKLEHFMPGEFITTRDGSMKFELLYSNPIESMDIEPWIEQRIFKDGITIRELIKSVADKEGAHSDLNYHDIVKYAKNWHYGNISSHIFGISGIAKLLYQIFG